MGIKPSSNKKPGIQQLQKEHSDVSITLKDYRRRAGGGMGAGNYTQGIQSF